MTTVRLHIKNVWTVLSGDVPDDVIHEVTRFHPENYEYMPRYRTKRKDPKTGKWVRSWDGYVKLYAHRKKVFPTGLLGRVTRQLKAHGYTVERIDERKAPVVAPVDKISLHGVELRDNQLECVELAVKRQRGVIKAATGFGKTEVIGGIIYKLNLPTIILVHKQDLLHQTAERLEERLGIHVGRIGDDCWDPAYVTVATFQSLYSTSKTNKEQLRKWLATFAVVMVDEAHHIQQGTGKDSYMNILKLVPAFYRYGLSATPFKEPAGSELPLIGWTGEMFYDFDLNRGVEEGILVKPYCFMLNYPQPLDNDELAEMKDYHRLYELTIIRNTARNQSIASICRNAINAGLPVAVVVERLEHGETLASLTGLPFLSGKHDRYTRELTLKAVNDGKIPGVISTLIDEGIDVPNLACIILAAGGKAPHRQIQRIGRGVRRGKHPYCIVVDFADDYNNDILNRQVTKRLNTYKQNKLVVHLVDALPDLKEFA